MGVFDLPGAEFLQLYGILAVLVLVAGFAIPRWMRPEGRERDVSDPDELAYLAGGASRFGDAVVVRLLASRALDMRGRRFAVETGGAGRTPAENAVLGLRGESRWSTIASVIRPHAAAIEDRLVDRELLISRGVAMQMRLVQSLPYLLLFLFGAIKWQVGVARDRPVGILTALLIATAVCGLIRFALVDRRTRGGLRALKEARTLHDRARRAPTAGDADMAVALFGTAVLAGSAWSGFHSLRGSAAGGDASGGGCGTSASSGGGSDGGGGCGGGGCGGCGS